MNITKENLIEIVGGILSSVFLYIRGSNSKRLLDDHSLLHSDLSQVKQDLDNILETLVVIKNDLDENTYQIKRLSRQFMELDRAKDTDTDYTQ